MWLCVIGCHELSTKTKHSGNTFLIVFTTAKRCRAPIETLTGEPSEVTGSAPSRAACGWPEPPSPRAWRLDGTVRTGHRQHCLDARRGLPGAPHDPSPGVLLRRHDPLQDRPEHDDDELRRAR